MSVNRPTERPFSRQVLAALSVNVERLSSTKEDLLANICVAYHCNILCLQETHRLPESNRPRVAGMNLAVERLHPNYGSAMFVKEGTILESTSSTEGIVILEVLTVEQDKIVVT